MSQLSNKHCERVTFNKNFPYMKNAMDSVLQYGSEASSGNILYRSSGGHEAVQLKRVVLVPVKGLK